MQVESKRLRVKKVVGKFKNKRLVEGDVNSISDNEILVTYAMGYTVLRTKTAQGIDTKIIIPLSEFTHEGNK